MTWNVQSTVEVSPPDRLVELVGSLVFVPTDPLEVPLDELEVPPEVDDELEELPVVLLVDPSGSSSSSELVSDSPSSSSSFFLSSSSSVPLLPSSAPVIVVAAPGAHAVPEPSREQTNRVQKGDLVMESPRESARDGIALRNA